MQMQGIPAEPQSVQFTMLESFLENFDNLNQDNNNLVARLYSISERLNQSQEIANKEQPTKPFPFKSTSGLLSRLEHAILSYQDYVSNQRKLIEKLEQIL